MIQTTFPDRAVMAELLAKMLWEIKAVHFNAAQPYKLSSGMASPVYIDCRKLLSFPRIRSTVMDFAASTLLRDAGFEQFDCIAGGETAGIPFAALLADRLGLPMIYVRKQPKGHGRNAQIEGNMPEGSRVLVIEDLTTAGGSMFKFIDAVRAAGGIVDHGIALFFYGIFGEQRFADGKVRLHHIATWRNVLAVAKEQKLFDDKTLSEVEAFLDAPLAWSGRNGGVSELSL
ncbi:MULTISPECIES: orotate phosphoribosyltransferase [Rhizobium]|jgi:orotate phosphoribosyltransferase|uniref:Orotate phosphoribosyltransferase n=1 Tax=Rhizobium leguminosarum TaxID=384 RepID=A0A2K9YX54_RHILE|nr:MULTISPECIES: orotate phosphoribosyltransferase [Rhizobium]AUW40554.1 Orotate phosphoribosyltransferase [Rhizobium leguminosarum]MBY5458007.1 orotate phosphoribosyltransferase [Rhizobium leguminosarum]NKJ98885.1 orotate phosphoribosyltransferase [Rhizobium leguminosarum bv. viciae]NKL62060.1 orotate phosphoribosyltransferase [Rhizobium leguminosarum bv. viciae]QIO73023.1 orotate phosphoribosyltransferase [Rhizobium leguminosarum bv. trifolii]